MNIETYLRYFEDVVLRPADFPYYQDETIYNYTKLNWSRTNRWLKRFEPSDAMKEKIQELHGKQQWIIITEPWCGDAAHSVAQLLKIARLNDNIELDVQLRDSEPFLIDQYLTNGGKSVPKLIIRDEGGNDLFVWGPRPKVLQQQYEAMRAEGRSMDEIKELLQRWYNEDKGESLQEELALGLEATLEGQVK